MANRCELKCASAHSLKTWIVATLTTLSPGSNAVLAAQPPVKQSVGTPAAEVCLKTVLDAGYTLEDDNSRLKTPRSEQSNQTLNGKDGKESRYANRNRDDNDKDEKTDKDDKDDKDVKDDVNDKDDANDKDDKNDKDRDNRKASIPTSDLRGNFSGLLKYEVEKNGDDYDVYVDPLTCQIKAAIKD